MMKQMTAFLIVLIAGLFLSSHVVECNVRSLQASSSSSAHVSGGEGARASAGQSSSTCEGSCLLPFIAERSSTGGFAYSNRAGSATASGSASTDNTDASGSSSRPYGRRGFRVNADVDVEFGK